MQAFNGTISERQMQAAPMLLAANGANHNFQCVRNTEADGAALLELCLQSYDDKLGKELQAAPRLSSSHEHWCCWCFAVCVRLMDSSVHL